MPVITICSLKGGTGKSTIALNLASVLSTRRRKVLVIDADPQGTVSEWADTSQQDEPTVLVSPRADIHQQIDKARTAFPWTLIDTPPASTEETRSAIMAADRLILPVTPGVPDVRSTAKFLELYQRALQYKPDLEARLLINRVDRRTKLGRTIRLYLERKFVNLKIFDTEISQLTAFGAAYIAGQTIDNYQPKNKGTMELNRLAKEVLSWQDK